MAGHAEHSEEATRGREKLELAGGGKSLSFIALAVGAVGLVAALGLSFATDLGMRRFFFAYLVAFAFFLAITLAGIFFVLIQHLTRAGWSVNVRRIGESIASNVPVLGLLAIPIVISVVSNNGYLYRWAQPIPAGGGAHHGSAAPHGANVANATPSATPGGAAGGAATAAPAGHGDAHATTAAAKEGESALHGGPKPAGHGSAHGAGHERVAHGEIPEVHPNAGGHVAKLDSLTLSKRAWLNPTFFTLRIVFYFAVWSGLALWYRKQSLLQDKTGDIALTLKMQAVSAPCILVFALTFTFAAFDLLMSLDPHWFSTMFGVYYFAGSMLSMYATVIIAVTLLQKNGYLTDSITKEHFHDLGKWLFAFTFFWGYIGFSQFMLYWYASIPEEIGWLARRGATTRGVDTNAWGYVSIILLFGHLLIPFPGLLSRHIKRRRGTLVFWACWILVFHYLDIYWIVMPELDGSIYFGPVEIAAFVGVGGIVVAGIVRRLGSAPIRPLQDPRLFESMALQNV